MLYSSYVLSFLINRRMESPSLDKHNHNSYWECSPYHNYKTQNRYSKNDNLLAFNAGGSSSKSYKTLSDEQNFHLNNNLRSIRKDLFSKKDKDDFALQEQVRYIEIFKT